MLVALPGTWGSAPMSGASINSMASPGWLSSSEGSACWVGRTYCLLGLAGVLCTPVIQLDLPPWCYLVHQLAHSFRPHCSTAEPLYALYSSISPVSCSFLIFIGLWRVLAVQPVSVMVWFCCCCHITAYIALTSSSVSLLLFGVHFWALFGVWWSGQFALDFKHCPGPPVVQLESQVSPKHQIEWQVPTFSVQCWVVGIAKFSQVLKPSPLLLCR